MWVTVWGWPHLHRSDADRPHLNKFAWHWPWPVRKRFSKDQDRRGRSKPGCQMVGSRTEPWLTTEADSQASLHCARAAMSIGAVFVQIGWRDTSRLTGGLEDFCMYRPVFMGSNVCHQFIWGSLVAKIWGCSVGQDWQPSSLGRMQASCDHAHSVV